MLKEKVAIKYLASASDVWIPSGDLRIEKILL